MKERIYTPIIGTSTKEAIKNAVRMSRATGDTIIVKKSWGQFSVDQNSETHVMEFVAGFTIEQALQKAIDFAIESESSVIANINDANIKINKHTNIKMALADYHYQKQLQLKQNANKITNAK